VAVMQCETYGLELRLPSALGVFGVALALGGGLCSLGLSVSEMDGMEKRVHPIRCGLGCWVSSLRFPWW
jgi:hypothetical protein